MHPDAVFIIIAFTALAVAAGIVITLVRRHAREDAPTDAAPAAQEKASPTSSSEQ